MVINPDARPDRWRRVERMCRQRGIEPQRFSAHTSVHGEAMFPDSPLSPAERGLWSSFLGVVTANHDTEWILVLEDDVVLVPRFRRHALRVAQSVPGEVVTVRMGWLGLFTWHESMNIRRYATLVAKRILVRCRAWFRFLVRKDAEMNRPTRWGTHAVLIRVSGVDQLVQDLGMPNVPLDHAFLRLEESDPSRFTRSSRNRAWQRIGVSDIQADRRRRTGWD